jgi:transposase
MTTCFVGIDVAKATLEVALLPSGETFPVPNTAAGHARLRRRLQDVGMRLGGIVLEATGKLHLPVALDLAAAGLPVAVLNPAWVHAFAKSEGQRAKTDRSDALLLARYAQQKQPDPTPLADETTRQLQELVQCRERFVAMRTMERNRQQTATAIADLIRADPARATQAALVQSVPGIGPTLSAVLLATLPELGTVPGKHLASLAGLAPHPRESGQWRGQRRIGGGRSVVRRAMYLAAVTAVRSNPVLRQHYQQLRTRRPPTVALIACARRLLGILNAMVRDDLTWTQTRVGQGDVLPQAA